MSRPRHYANLIQTTTLTEVDVRPTLQADPSDLYDLMARTAKQGVRCADDCPYDGVCAQGQCLILES